MMMMMMMVMPMMMMVMMMVEEDEDDDDEDDEDDMNNIITYCKANLDMDVAKCSLAIVHPAIYIRISTPKYIYIPNDYIIQ